MDPGMIKPAGATQASTPVRPAAPAPGLEVTRVEVLPLQPGDRLVVHVDGAAGLSGGGGHALGEHVRAALKLDELGFDVPVLVVSPGIRVTVARPA